MVMLGLVSSKSPVLESAGALVRRVDTARTIWGQAG